MPPLSEIIAVTALKMLPPGVDPAPDFW